MTDELHLFLAKNKKRVGGEVTVGISRLSVHILMSCFAKGWTIKDVIEAYPQLSSSYYGEREAVRVIKKLTKDLLDRGWRLKD